jgi:SAM-dependent methyltransferase
MQRPDWAGGSTDMERPSAARMYDYLLGGSHNFAVDREAARQVIAVAPDAPLVAQANRAFLRRAVRFLVDNGVRQFLDIGSGIPTVGNVHEIAQQLASDTRVMYVDVDPVAVAHSRVILAGNERTGIVQVDLRQPERIVNHPDVHKLLDFDQPVAVMIVAVLHFIPDSDDPARILSTLRAALAPGSYVALSQVSGEGREKETESIVSVYRTTDNSLYPRTRTELRRFFAGFDLVPPGVVWVPEWRPETVDSAGSTQPTGVACGVGRLSG